MFKVYRYDSLGVKRRTFIATGTIGLGTSFIGRRAHSQIVGKDGSKTAAYAFVGCYTTAERHARGDGIHVYRMDYETGVWQHVQHLRDLVNPSFLVLSRDQRFLYSVHGD